MELLAGLLSFIVPLTVVHAAASQAYVQSCASLFERTQTNEILVRRLMLDLKAAAKESTLRHELPPESDQELLQKALEYLQTNPIIEGRQHPRSLVSNDINQLGLFQEWLLNALPILKQTQSLRQQILDKAQPDQSDRLVYEELRNQVFKNIYVIQKSGNLNAITIYAAMDALRDLMFIDSSIPSRQVTTKKEDIEKNEQDRADLKEREKGKLKKTEPSKRHNKLSEKPQTETKPQNKDLKGSDLQSEPYYGFGTTAPVFMSLMRLEIFDVNGEKMRKNFALRSPKSIPQLNYRPHRKTESTFLLNESDDGGPGEAREILIPKGYGYSPVVTRYSEGYLVEEIGAGEFRVRSTSNGALPRKIQIWLEQDGIEVLTPEQVQGYTQKSGILQKAWPKHIQNAIQLARLRGGKDSEKIALALSEWFQFDGPNLYNSSDRDPEKFNEANRKLQAMKGQVDDALAMALVQMFNCDGAAKIGVVLLRDFFGIPARYVVGYPVPYSMNFEGKRYNVGNLNEPSHAWVEIFNGQQWIPLDFTPTKNNPQGKSKPDKIDKSNDPSKRRQETQKPSEDPNQDVKKKQRPQSDSKDSSSDSDQRSSQRMNGRSQNGERVQESEKEDLAQDGKQSKNNQIENVPPAKDQREKGLPKSPEKSDKKDPSEDEKKAPSQIINKDDVLDRRHLPSITQLPKNLDSPLGAYTREIMIDTIEKGFTSLKRSELLGHLFNLTLDWEQMKPYNELVRGKLTYQLEKMYGIPDKSIHDLITESKGLIHSKPSHAYRILKQVQSYLKFLQEWRSLNREESEFNFQLEEILAALKNFSHPNSKQHRLIERMFQGLPGQISKKIILDKYPEALNLGSADQNALFQEIVRGDWRGVYQASLVSKHFNFLLEPESEYKLRAIKSLMRDSQRRKGNDGLVLAGIEDIGRFERWIFDPEFHPDTSMMILGKLMRDEQYMMWYRQLVPSPGSHKPVERKHTNVFFDISKSMEGDPAQIQASAIAAIVDKAFSEKDPFGNPLHEVILFPFADKVFDGIHIKSVDHAKRTVLEFLTRPPRVVFGTKFQPCFDKHFEMIHEYSGPRGRTGTLSDRLRLKKTNMILITDGEGPADYKKINSDIQNLPQGVQTFINLVSIGKENQELVKLAQSTNTKSSQGMATTLTVEMMSKFIEEASNPKIDPDAFVVDEHLFKMSPSLLRSIQQLRLPTFETHVPFSTVRDRMRKVVGHPEIDPEGSAMVIRDIHGLITRMSQAQVPEDVRIKIFEMILANYEHWTGRRLDRLSELEVLVLKKIVDGSQ